MKADSGEYRAVAKNKHGQGVATINLNFEGGDKLKYALFLCIQIFFKNIFQNLIKKMS